MIYFILNFSVFFVSQYWFNNAVFFLKKFVIVVVDNILFYLFIRDSVVTNTTTKCILMRDVLDQHYLYKEYAELSNIVSLVF